MRKTAIRYLRISTDRQSNYSIHGQDMHTHSWCERNDVQIVDTFTDEGFSARNFDRPDFQKLVAFVAQHYRTVDYLVVNSFDRFSREAGEAIVEIKKLQRKFGIKVVSVTENVIFDADDPGSFFYAGLMLLKGEDEIIRNRSRINLGIYTAKKKEGRYLGSAPIGYRNSRDDRNKPIIVPDEEKVLMIHFIFNNFVNNVPVNEISSQIRKMGFDHKGHSAIQKILKNPTYAGMLQVKAYKEYPEEIVEGIHTPLIDKGTWYMAQDKMRKRQPVQIVCDDLPLRSVLLCHCGKPITGAPSRGKSGKYWNYYKCNSAGHNNFSAKKAHEQLLEAFSYMSLPVNIIVAVKSNAEKATEERLKTNKLQLQKLHKEQELTEQQLMSVETKWINDQMNVETYQRWFTDLTTKRNALKAQAEKLSTNANNVYTLLESELTKLTDLKGLYSAGSTIQKQQFIRMLFAGQLYYSEKIYRTPYIMQEFAHNELILKQKQLLVLEKKGENIAVFPAGGAEGSLIEPFTSFLSFIRTILVA